jgi:alanine racemase
MLQKNQSNFFQTPLCVFKLLCFITKGDVTCEYNTNKINNMSRSAVAILSTENLLHNISVIRKLCHPTKIIAMVKANAYGHGIRSVALRLEGHVDMFGVASVDEALILRKVDVKTPIILMQGVFESSELLIASTENFHVVFNNINQIEWLEQAHLPKPLHAWIKINTGMARLGFNLDDAKSVHAKLLKHKNIAKPVRVMSHFACADDKTNPLNAKQINAFSDFVQGIDSEFSLCNSAGIFNFPECSFDYVRPGLALYGVSPIKGKLAQDYGLKPVMSVKTSLISIQNLKRGDSVGYGATYSCPEDMPVGIATFGYGDGYPITAKNGAPIIVNDTLCSLAGRVSMDMLAIDLRACPNAKIGDPVTLWGEGLPVEKLVDHTSNITWDLLTGVQNRVKFIWTS